LLSLPGGQVVHTFPGDMEEAAFSPDGGLLAFASPGEGALWDARTGSLVRRLSLPPEAGDQSICRATPAFSPRGDRLALGESVWDTATGGLVWDSCSRSATFSPRFCSPTGRWSPAVSPTVSFTPV